MSSTIRDDFAKRAMQALIQKRKRKTFFSKLKSALTKSPKTESVFDKYDQVAEDAYIYADAMMEYRKKQNNG